MVERTEFLRFMEFMEFMEVGMTSTVEIDRLARLEADAQCVALLRAHIPLSLLMDLAQADPHSAELYAQEQRSSSEGSA